MATSIPNLAAITAWLAPLPPKPQRNSLPTTVSPSSGSRSAYATRPIIVLPTTTMLRSLTATPITARPDPRHGAVRHCVHATRPETTDGHARVRVSYRWWVVGAVGRRPDVAG